VDRTVIGVLKDILVYLVGFWYEPLLWGGSWCKGGEHALHTQLLGAIKYGWKWGNGVTLLQWQYTIGIVLVLVICLPTCWRHSLNSWTMESFLGMFSNQSS